MCGCSRGETSITDEHYIHHRLDVSDENEVKKWVNFVHKKFGHINSLLCCAGYAPANLLVSMTSGKIFERVLKTNVMGTAFPCKEVSRHMMKQKYGSIVTVSSMAAGLHMEGTAAYAASKAAISEFTKILAKEMARFNVNCNVIAPSVYQTDMVKRLGEDITSSAINSLQVKRPLKIEELTSTIEFLLKEESQCITGQVIYLSLVN